MDIGSKTQTRDINELQSGTEHELLLAGNLRTFTAAEGWPRAIRCDEVGILEMTDHTGPTTVSYKVLQGEVIHFRPKSITANTTADVQIWW